jgi:hypothetical protein
MADRKRRALEFVLLVGAMSFFADFVYERARGIAGPYLALALTTFHCHRP